MKMIYAKKAAALASVLAMVGIVLAPMANAANDTYGVTLSTNVQEVMALDCGGTTVNLGNLTPGTPVTGSSICTATTNANGGYILSVKRDDATSTLNDTATGAVTIADKAETPATAAVWAATGLGYTVFASTATKDAEWGTGTTETDGANNYAGFIATQDPIMTHLGYSDVATTTSIGYKLDVPSTQRSGAYDGTITYSATTTP